MCEKLRFHVKSVNLEPEALGSSPDTEAHSKAPSLPETCLLPHWKTDGLCHTSSQTC